MPEIVIRRASDRAKFFGARGWVCSAGRARRFSTPHEAIVFCFERDLKDAEIVVRFPEPCAPDVVICLPQHIANTHSPEPWTEFAEQTHGTGDFTEQAAR